MKMYNYKLEQDNNNLRYFFLLLLETVEVGSENLFKKVFSVLGREKI